MEMLNAKVSTILLSGRCKFAPICGFRGGLILPKLYALPLLYRQGNFARVGLYENDVATLIHAYRPQLEGLFRELSHHLSEDDLTQVKEIVADAHERIERFADNSKNTSKKQ